MSQVQIVSVYENYEKILDAYSVELKKFVAAMDGLVSESDGIIGMLGSSWKGDAYDKFSRTSRKGFDEIRASLSVVKDISDEIDRKVPKFHKLVQQLKGEK